MKHLLSIIFVIIFENMISYGQERPFSNQYLLNSSFLNPAMLGTEKPIVKLIHRQQWHGINGAPMTSSLFANTNSGRYTFFGLGLYNDSYGVVRNQAASFTFAYHSVLERVNNDFQKLSFGLTLKMQMHYFKPQDLVFHDENDLSIMNFYDKKEFLPDADAGIHYYNSRFYTGLVAGGLLLPYFPHTDYWGKEIYGYGYVGFKKPLNKNLSLETMILVKKTETSPTKLETSMKFIMQKTFFIAGSYRLHIPLSPKTYDCFQLLVGGLAMNKLHLAYVFEFSLAKIYFKSLGTHEFMIAWNLPERGGRGWRPGRGHGCPAYK